MTWRKCTRSCDQELLGEDILDSEVWLLLEGDPSARKTKIGIYPIRLGQERG